MDCPKCGQTDVDSPACPRCGVVFAKLRPTRERAAAPASEPPPAAPRDHRTLILELGAVALALVFAAWLLKHPRTPAPPRARPDAAPTLAPPPPPPSLALEPEPPTPSPLPPISVPEVPTGGMSLDDYRMAKQLADDVQSAGPIDGSSAQAAESLVSRYPREAPLKRLLVAVLVKLGAQARARRSYDEALADLRRAITVGPDSPQPRALLIDVLIETEDWAGAESAARDFLSLKPGDAAGLRDLGYALMRQDRNREAAEALRASLAVREDTRTRALLDRVQKGMADERGMTEQRLARFNVRYDGAAHEDVGREIMRQLDHHFATLSVALDYQPTVTIPVILFSQQAYYNASGAPAWAGGDYNHLDGRIRVPIGGLTSSLTPDMDGTLIHELTHAFIADRTRGVAPHDIHEGLAQYMEGKRVASLLTPAQLKGLADGRIGGVGGFYLGALSFVEYLEAQRGQGGMNDLLRTMGETGDVNEAFRRVYGQDYPATQQAWFTRLRQEHGS